MTNEFRKSARQIQDVHATLEQDLVLLKEIQQRTSQISKQYGEILSTQKDVGVQFNENLDVVEKISRSVARNLTDVIDGDFRSLARDLSNVVGRIAADGIMENVPKAPRDRLFEGIVNTTLRGAVSTRKGSGAFQRSNGQGITEVARILRVAARHL